MSGRFVSVDRTTPYLLPPSLDEWLPEDHLARFVVEIVEQLDLSELERQYSGRGSAAYHPGMLLGLLFYGYATGVFSSRRLEQATYDSIAFRYIAANTHPDHDTIATFRRRFLPQLQSLFLQILVLAAEMDLVKVGNVSLDGTKVKANASKHSALSWDHACKLEGQLQQEVEALLARAEETDRAEQPLDIPAELARRETRLVAIAEAKARIEARAGERYGREQAEYERKMQAREAKQKAMGKKPRGRTPKPPEPGPQPKDQVNLTDAESRIMPESGGGFEQAYNVQAAVDMDSLLIVGQHVSQAPNDKRELEAALAELDRLPEEVGQVETVVTDNGYYGEANLKVAEDRDIVPLIAMGRERHNLSLAERLNPGQPLAEPKTAAERLARRLQSEAGKALYARRKCTVEPVFGVIKAVMGFRQFLLRGKEKVSGEWTLVTIAWNLKRMAKLQAMHA